MTWAYGDSKTTAAGYPPLLETAINATRGLDYRVTVGSVGGATVAIRAASIAADLAALPLRVNDVLINLGSNDVSALPAEATWKADLSAILDAMHTQWPSAKVYVMRPWRRDYATECDSLATWIADVISTRSAWALVGPDERVFLENGDDGVTYATDGVHPNAAGYALTAAQWQTVMGY